MDRYSLLVSGRPTQHQLNTNSTPTQHQTTPPTKRFAPTRLLITRTFESLLYLRLGGPIFCQTPNKPYLPTQHQKTTSHHQFISPPQDAAFIFLLSLVVPTLPRTITCRSVSPLLS